MRSESSAALSPKAVQIGADAGDANISKYAYYAGLHPYRDSTWTTCSS